MMHRGRAQNVVEAAALIAAQDLSKIVVNDPDFGWVSLSNHPAEGKITRARDGEPLPVLGINTLVGTLRQNAILAQELRNPTISSLVDKDLKSLQATIRRINYKLFVCLSSNSPVAYDKDGNYVRPLEDVTKFLSQNLPGNLELKSVKLSLGWLDDGSESSVMMPKPESFAQVSAEDSQAGQYDAFKSVPVAGKNFTFAGLGKQAHLVSNRNFMKADNKHICSIVKVECLLIPRDDPAGKITCVACSQPQNLPDQATHGVMTVRFSGQPVAGLYSWRDFLSNASFQDNSVINFDVYGGDFPLDKTARLYKSKSAPASATTSEQFAEHLYYWLRNGRLLPRVDAVLSMLNEPFQSRANQIYTYQFKDDGSISRSVIDGSDFSRSVVADGQESIMADARTRSGANAIILFRDNVKKLGTRAGKHGGQPLADYPLGKIDGWVDQSQLSSKFSRRKSSSSGLAVDIEIGGTNPSTAMKDVISMRNATKNRRI